MDILDDIISGTPVAKVSRFKPKAKGQPKKAPSKVANANVGNVTKEQPPSSDLPLSVQSDVSVKETSEAPTSSSPTKTKDTSEAPTSSSLTKTKDTIGLSTITTEHSETSAPDVSGIQNDEIPVFLDVSFTHQDSDDFQINVEQLEAGNFSCLDEIEEMNEAGGKKASKFKPKPKPKLHDIAKDQSQNAVFEDTESLMTPDMSEQGGKNGKFYDLNAPDNPPDEGPTLLGVEANDNTYEFVGGTNDNVHVDNKSPTKSHDELGSNREENDNGEHLEADKSKKKRVRRSKTAVSENDKPSRKRKKVSQEPDKSIDKPPKKFPRATRRKRCVDKTLLEVPEDELDFHKLPIKDLILLAEYKERETKKQVTSGQQQSTNERTDNMQSEGQPYDDDALDFDQDRDLSENPSTSGIQTDTGYYNYHSFRKIQPRAKWSKKDTEMFYQGIRQFGTDLSMIQQLFPGRSLEQIRSKYKKEQKQNPMMMHDAQTTRATDNSCFELVIKTLEAAREAEKEYYGSSDDDLVHPTGKEGKPEDIETHARTTQEEAENSEQNLKDKAASEEPDRPESPVITYDDDDDGWDTYTGL